MSQLPLEQQQLGQTYLLIAAVPTDVDPDHHYVGLVSLTNISHKIPEEVLPLFNLALVVWKAVLSFCIYYLKTELIYLICFHVFGVWVTQSY